MPEIDAGSRQVGVLVGLRAKARERSLRFLDFLEAYYLLRYPAVHDIADYDDVRVASTNIPASPGIALVRGPELWLTADLVDLPVTPELPESLAAWSEEPISALVTPSLRHPDPSSRVLLELLADPPHVNGRTLELDQMDSEQLASRGITGVAEGHVLEAAFTAQDELDPANQRLAEWVSSVWQPWADRWVEIERGRAFYKEIFDLRMRMERDRDLFELVWGFSRLRWRPQVVGGSSIKVDHPLMTVPMEIALDPTTGVLSMSPAGAPTIELSWSVGLPLSDRQGFLDQRKSAEQIELDPWGPDIEARVRGLLRSIDHDGTLIEAVEPASAGTHAVVAAGEWELFVRRRQPNFRGFLDDQRAIYLEEDSLVPDPFAALVIDEPSLLDPADPSGLVQLDDPEGLMGAEAERLLLPLAANHEQMQILTLAQHRAGVTAQGPPGTGKSHTIANLISHYVAHGKRVLVTAEKEQALSVLVDKVPEDIRELCVPVLGADASARARLQASITRIADAAHQRPDHKAIVRLEVDLDSLDSRYARTTNQLAERRKAETEPAPLRLEGVDPSQWTPSTAAAWLADHSYLSGIPDALGLSTLPPLSSDEFADLTRLCESLGVEEAARALATLPDSSSLPTGDYLTRLRLEADELRGFLTAVDHLVADWGLVDATNPETLRQIAASLDSWADWHLKASGTWIARVLADSADPSRALFWHQFCTEAEKEREAVNAANRALAAHTVQLTTFGPQEVPDPHFMEQLTQARDRLVEHKSIGVLHIAAKKAVDTCLVDGRVPGSATALDCVFSEVSRRTYRRQLITRWANIAQRMGGPELDQTIPVEDEMGHRVQIAASALSWRSTVWPAFAEQLRGIGISVPGDPAASDLANLANACVSLVRRARLVEIDRELRALAERLAHQSSELGASHLWQGLADALGDSRENTWDELRTEAARLVALRPLALRRKELLEKLALAAPTFADRVAASPDSVDPATYLEGWRWRQVEVWFEELDRGPEPAQLQADLEQLAKDRRRVTSQLVSARAWAGVSQSLDDRRRKALAAFTTANVKLGKGTGKYAPVWEQALRNAMNDAKDAVPVWIMPIHRVISSFRPTEEPPFDVIIVDEASQVGILEVVVLGLAKRAIVVGDDQQTSPENVGMNQQGIFDLLDEYLSDIPDRKTRFAPNNSLYDVSRQQFPQIVQLREHFRCLPRIINFSNHHWYNDTIVPLRDRPPVPGWQPLGSVYVPGGTRRRSDDTNRDEAEAVVSLIAELIENPEYEGKTFGVITLLGSGQAPLISGLLLDYLGPTVMEELEIRVGDPAGFQGDERDIIILSMVVAHDPDHSIGALNTPAAARRINVAASRARDQMWIVHSVGPESLNHDEPRRSLLEHCLHNPEATAVESTFELAESQFERDVLTRIVDAGYVRVVAQYPVGGYRIDLVVEGPESRLAVECDGDRWHGPEQWDHDRSRQVVLERAGWTFERIRAPRSTEIAALPLSRCGNVLRTSAYRKETGLVPVRSTPA